MTIDPLTLTMNAAPLVLSIGDESLTLSLGASIGGTARRGRLVELDASATLPVTGAGNTYVNTGGALTASLPASGTIVGDAIYSATFVTTVAAMLRIQAQGSDVIRYYGTESAAGGYLEIADRDAVLEVRYVGAGVFVVTSALREWSFGP